MSDEWHRQTAELTSDEERAASVTFVRWLKRLLVLTAIWLVVVLAAFAPRFGGF